MQFEPGKVLLHYRLVEKLGEGGMGVVWRALDTTLNREVAVKILPDVFANDPDRSARFEREARVLASLNHPNITTVHSVHQVDGLRFLVMELARGEDLSARLARGPLPLDETLLIARQIAEALEAAHESGVVHRDLKPANITVTDDGKVELLDFGLSKALDPSGSSPRSDLSQSPTQVTGHTAAGMILGTAAYMSPEQARGKPVDRRADIWAFGCVLYEMLTRRKAFDGETVTDVLAAVVTRDPDWSAIPSATPRRLVDLLRRCLEKDPQRRLRDAGEIRIVLEDVVTRPAGDPAPALAGPSRRRVLPWIATGILAVTVIALLSARRHEANEPTRLSVVIPPNDIVDGGFENGVLAVSRDGRTLAYSGRREGVMKLYVRGFGDGQVEELAGTDGAHSPFFSPDGKWIAFFADNKLKKISLAGGTAFDICDVAADRGGVWLDDGSIVFAPSGSSPLMRVSTAGGPVNAVTALDSTREERTHRWPDVLPGGEWIIFTVGSRKTPGDYEKSVIAAVSVRTGERRDLCTGASTARYAAPGYLVLARNGVLLAAPMEVDKPRLTGEPVPVTDGVAGERTSGANHFAVSRNGTLVFVPEVEGEDDVELAWVDRKGGVEVLDAPARPYVMPNLSPDGRRVLVAVGPSYGSGDIWEYDMDRGTMTRLTFDGKNLAAMWTPDQRSVVYQNEDSQGKDGPFHVSVKPLDGDVEGHAIFSAPRPMIIDDVTPDGRFVLFDWWGDPQSDIYVIPIDGSAGPVTVAAGAAEQRIGSVSPDGKWLTYQSRETGTLDVYVRPFPSGEGKWQVSSGGGARPIWSPKGGELFWSWSGRMYGATVQVSGRTISFGPPRSLFDLPPGRRSDSNLPIYDVAPDGSRFLTTRVAHPELSRRRIDVILNWSNQLRGLEKKGISQ